MDISLKFYVNTNLKPSHNGIAAQMEPAALRYRYLLGVIMILFAIRRDHKQMEPSQIDPQLIHI